MDDKYEVVITLEGRNLDVTFGPAVMDYESAIRYKKIIASALLVAEQLEKELKDEDYLYSYDSELEEYEEDDLDSWLVPDERDE